MRINFVKITRAYCIILKNFDYLITLLSWGGGNSENCVFTKNKDILNV